MFDIFEFFFFCFSFLPFASYDFNMIYYDPFLVGLSYLTNILSHLTNQQSDVGMVFAHYRTTRLVNGYIGKHRKLSHCMAHACKTCTCLTFQWSIQSISHLFSYFFFKKSYARIIDAFPTHLFVGVDFLLSKKINTNNF